ncbi:MAG: glycosyltransferase [Moorea sp. SIO4E2]|uniref:glycosyltransferase n=1 Tax=Moorena sp. SIO4E2 TaxID=2607826 RepID=UPI0013B6D95F|nr:glycosyltransferase [Moorena sp. SIO4E2]NEQ09002.1 glycosyltransferase [Moorena sp. SIO4E2]
MIVSENTACVTNTRPKVQGKFIFVDQDKFYIRGVTYGAFKPDQNGKEYHNLTTIDRDFALMKANGINTVRIPHTMPPCQLLDIANQHGLKVMVGLSAEQYVGYLIDKKKAPDIEAIIRDQVRVCAGHPAILCYALGNEIPAPLVRWLGRRRVEKYLERLYRAVKAEDPEGIVTYVNYPTTEYLQLPFLDLVCFNVYLESQNCFQAYLARLQNIAGDRPLLMSEVGLDALRNGEQEQAQVLDWQIRTAFAAGCVGCFVFAWTDEWYRGGAEVDDWEFGITTKGREPKPALERVSQAFHQVPFGSNFNYPRISVVICTYNGASTIRDTLEALQSLEYPDFEVIVVNDGSTDSTFEIAKEYNVKLITTENRGLSNARNTGWQAATGEIVAYLDDDAYPDAQWLQYLAYNLITTDYVGIGGPNLAPAGDGSIAACVAHAPGNPMPVLISDLEAEHIAGCNMAFRRDCLEAIGGFDPRFRTAGDDVDVCWQLQQCGRKLGYSPAALVWHYRRNSISAYWKQQVGYGKAEALLEQKWPEKYNQIGHLDWQGRVYGLGIPKTLQLKRWRVYQGVWGSAPFQSLHQCPPNMLVMLSLMPEWYLVILLLLGISALGALWQPLLISIVPLILSIVLPIIQAILSGFQASFTDPPKTWGKRLKLHSLTAFLHLLQPLARLYGRINNGLTPWRRRSQFKLRLPVPQSITIWSELWQEPEKRLLELEKALQNKHLFVQRGGDYDCWDLEVRRGIWGSVLILMAIEDHGSGTQLVRFRAWPRFFLLPSLLTLFFATLSALAALDQVWSITFIFGFLTGLLVVQIFRYCAAAMAYYHQAVKEIVK